MNPLAFIAFLVGIQGTPAQQAPTQQPEQPTVQKPTPKPGKEVGAPKRGGWDRN